MIDETKVDALIGLTVDRAWIGVGSFLVIDLLSVDEERPSGSVWTYLCDWAVTHAGVEAASSDATIDDAGLSKLAGLKFVACVPVDDEEFHLDFSGDARLEVWENREAYGPKAEALKIYKNGVYTTSITF